VLFRRAISIIRLIRWILLEGIFKTMSFYHFSLTFYLSVSTSSSEVMAIVYIA
jgi:hypothetical protein